MLANFFKVNFIIVYIKYLQAKVNIAKQVQLTLKFCKVVYIFANIFLLIKDMII